MNQISLKMKYLMMKLTQEYLEGKPPIETANRSREENIPTIEPVPPPR